MLRSAPLLLVVCVAVWLGTCGRAAAGELESAWAAGELGADAGGLEVGWWALAPRGAFGGEAPLARSGALSFGVRAGMARNPGERRRMFGVLELNIGLDDWVGARFERADELAMADADPAAAGTEIEANDAAGSRRAPPAAAGDLETQRFLLPGLPLATARASDGPGRLARDADRGEPGPPPAPTRHDASVGDGRGALATARLARALVAEALRVHGSAAELRRLDGMASRSRAAASLPEVRLGAGTASDESLRLTPTVSDPARFTRDGGRDVWLEARLTWRLDSAIFARDEIAIMRLRAQRQEESQRLAREVLEALVEWRKANLVQHSPLALPEERDVASIRQFGAVARLDVLTDGWFSRYLERWGPSAGLARWP